MDPFCGSGTTAKSAQILNRGFIGIEQNPNYCQYSRDRLDMTREELRDKYAHYVGGRKTKVSKTKTRKLVVSKVKKNTTFSKSA